MAFVFDQLKILIVDDEAHTRTLIKEVLQIIGFSQANIREASDGLSAFKSLEEEKVHIIISDWRMEPMDGLTFVRKLRDQTTSPDPFVPVIFCSAHTDQEMIERARDMGVNEVIAKPVSIGNIESRIIAVLEQPRPFVAETQYFGPDRRRRRDGPTDGKDRRQKKRVHIKSVQDET